MAAQLLGALISAIYLLLSILMVATALPECE
jgi:hypothetical protein